MKPNLTINSSDKPVCLIIKIIVLILFILNFSVTFAQSRYTSLIKSDSAGYVDINGYVEKNNNPLPNANVIVYENNKEVINNETSRDGKFEIKLAFNRYYDVEVTKSGLVNKKFSFDTYLPDTVNNHYIFPFEFTIVLFPKYKDIDMSILNKPLAIIRYDNKYKDFFYDYDYAKSTNNEVLLLKTKVDELVNEYNECMDIGNNYFKSQQYNEALYKFERAHNIFPDETEPVNKINEINNILKKK